MWPFKRLMRGQTADAVDNFHGIQEEEPLGNPVLLSQGAELAATAPPESELPENTPIREEAATEPPHEEPPLDMPAAVLESLPDPSPAPEGPVPEPPPPTRIPNIPERQQRWLPPAMSTKALQRLRETGRLVPFKPFPDASPNRFVGIRRTMASRPQDSPPDPPKPAPADVPPLAQRGEQPPPGRGVPHLPFSRTTSTRPPSVQRPVWNVRREVAFPSDTSITRHRPGG